MPHTYEYPRPALTVDCVVFGLDDEDLKVILIQRDLDPFQGRWALPGGFVEMDETLENAALRELEEETGIRNVFLEQLYTFGEPNRDPREGGHRGVLRACESAGLPHSCSDRCPGCRLVFSKQYSPPGFRPRRGP